MAAMKATMLVRTMMPIVLMAAMMSATACGQGEQSGPLAERTPPVDTSTAAATPTATKPATTKPTATTNTDAAATTSTTIPESSPAERTAAAQLDWDNFINDTEGGLRASNVAMVDGRVIAATSSLRIDAPEEPILIWEPDDVGGWNVTDEVFLDSLFGWGATMPLADPSRRDAGGFNNVLDITLIDLTGDGSAEMMIEYAPNTPVGALFTNAGGRWDQVYVSERLYLENDRVIGYQRTCDPNCAEGVVLEYEIAWTGQQFEQFYLFSE